MITLANNFPVQWSSLRNKLARYFLNLFSRILGRLSASLILPLCSIFILSLYISSSYLNFDPNINPSGREYLSEIDSHQFWINLKSCGTCALWNGSYRGGFPGTVAFDSFLHPLVMATTLLYGVVNGSKLAIPIALMVGGLGQWWLCRELKVSLTATIWTVSIAVVGGHLSGRMENGAFTLLFMTACTSLYFPSIIRLMNAPNKVRAVQFALVLANLIYGGIGYPQICIGLLTALLWAIHCSVSPNRRTFSAYLVFSAVLSLALAGPVIVPLANFGSNFAKEGFTDFKGNQPFYLVVVNFISDSVDYYKSTTVGKMPYPYLYNNFIGWLPVILAFYSAFNQSILIENSTKRMLVLSAVFVCYLSTGEFFRVLADTKLSTWITTFSTGIRSPTLMQGIAVSPILGLAALGFDALMKLPSPELSVTYQSFVGAQSNRSISSSKIVLSFLIASNILNCVIFSGFWMTTTSVTPTVSMVLDALKTESLEWVNIPFGEHYFLQEATARNLKLAVGIRKWWWRDRKLPEPLLEAVRSGNPPGWNLITTADYINIFATNSSQRFAVIRKTDGSEVICNARGIGAILDVSCPQGSSGILTVRENAWRGWTARTELRSLELQGGQWLQVTIDDNENTVSFRYRPYDIYVGITLMFFGIIACVFTVRSKTS